MQRFQFGRRLTLFRQSRMGEQGADVMGYAAEQIAIVCSIGSAVEWPPQGDECREPSLRANRETECRPGGRQDIWVAFDYNRLIFFQELRDHRMG